MQIINSEVVGSVRLNTNLGRTLIINVCASPRVQHVAVTAQHSPRPLWEGGWSCGESREGEGEMYVCMYVCMTLI